MGKQSENYEDIASFVRRRVLELSYHTNSGHIGSCFSIVEILVALYYDCLSVSPADPDDPSRDRFILSKGHACLALYTILARRGFMDERMLEGFAVDGGTLEHHPARDVSRGIEVSSGSLGHGLSIGAGMAIAAKYDKSQHRVFVLLSDGETNEGSTWEAAMLASHHKLDNLIAIVDYNKMQALGYTSEIVDLEPIADRWRAFGWGTVEVDGHDFEEIKSSLNNIPNVRNRPTAVIAHTTKGKGVSFMEDNILWHYRCPDENEYMKALRELG